jgi:hypothetical protein
MATDKTGLGASDDYGQDPHGHHTESADKTAQRMAHNSGKLILNLGRGIPHEQCGRILTGSLQDAVKLFVRRQAEYGESANHLGAKGQFADINRKFWKLKRLMWDENVPEDAISESAEEVLMDFIGHALLGIHFLRQEKQETLKYEGPTIRLNTTDGSEACPDCGSQNRPLRLRSAPGVVCGNAWHNYGNPV